MMYAFSIHSALQGRCIFLVFRSMNSSRAHLRFHHALDVDILREADVAVPQYRLDGFVIDAQGVKVRRGLATNLDVLGVDDKHGTISRCTTPDWLVPGGPTRARRVLRSQLDAI